MGYMHIENLYKPTAQTILLFKECFALEKIHGTSAHIAWDGENMKLSYFSGGESHDRFVALFDGAFLLNKFNEIFGATKVIVYGEAYGGKQQGMSATYGPDLRFVVFDVKVGDTWLNVINAHDVADKLELDFVHYVKIPTDLDELNKWRDAPSFQAIKLGVSKNTNAIKSNGVSDYSNWENFENPRKREGVVLRPLHEFTDNRGNRVIVKHKRDDFRETKTPREVSPEKLKVLEEAEAIANEWVTNMRLQHVLDKIPNHSIEMMGTIIKSMQEDVLREAEGEIVVSKEAVKAIGKKTAQMYKSQLKDSLTVKD